MTLTYTQEFFTLGDEATPVSGTSYDALLSTAQYAGGMPIWSPRERRVHVLACNPVWQSGLVKTTITEAATSDVIYLTPPIDCGPYFYKVLFMLKDATKQLNTAANLVVWTGNTLKDDSVIGKIIDNTSGSFMALPVQSSVSSMGFKLIADGTDANAYHITLAGPEMFSDFPLQRYFQLVFTVASAISAKTILNRVVGWYLT